MSPEPSLLVALHDIEPATFERAALLRDWLADLGVSRVTLLVIPARDRHPLSDRRPEVATWLLEQAHHGDAIAQHGFRHSQTRPARWPPHPFLVIARESPEFVGPDPMQTVRALDAGRRILKLAGIEPRGSSLPPTPTHRSCASPCARDSSGGRACGAVHPTHAGAPQHVSAPQIGLAACGPLRRAASRALLRIASRLAGPMLRVDVHPLDLASAVHMIALEDVIRRATTSRACVTYDDLASAQSDLASVRDGLAPAA